MRFLRVRLPRMMNVNIKDVEETEHELVRSADVSCMTSAGAGNTLVEPIPAHKSLD